MENMLGDGWTGCLFGLACLDGRFLIGANHPDAILQQRMGVLIELQDRTGTVQKCLLILDVLPGMEPPGADLLGSEPPPNRSG